MAEILEYFILTQILEHCHNFVYNKFERFQKMTAFKTQRTYFTYYVLEC